MLILLVYGVLTLLLVILIFFAIYQAPRNQIGYIGLPNERIPAVIKALGATSGQVVDLGCGDGRVIPAVLHANKQATACGVEINPVVMALARIRLAKFQSRVQFVRANLVDQDLRSASRAFTYLNHPTMAMLEPKLEAELKKGARLVSCDFPLPNRKPNKTITIGAPWQLGQKLYIYDY